MRIGSDGIGGFGGFTAGNSPWLMPEEQTRGHLHRQGKTLEAIRENGQCLLSRRVILHHPLTGILHPRRNRPP
jgi:hypothetical protein